MSEKFKSLSYQGSSMKSEVILDMSESCPVHKLDYLDPQDPYETIISIEIKGIYESDLCGEDFMKSTALGSIEATVLNQSKILHEGSSNIWDVADAISAEFNNAWCSVYNAEGELYPRIRNASKHSKDTGESYGFAYIDTLYIKEEYRCMGVGRKVLKDLPHILGHFCNFDINILILSPVPIEFINARREPIESTDSKYPELYERLLKFYKKCGYKLTSKGSESMFKFTNSKGEK